MTTLNAIFAQISTLSLEEKRMLNKMLVSQLNSELKEKQRDAACQFRIGDVVAFDAGRKGGLTTIKIQSFSRDMSKIKGKQVAGMALPSTNWTVPATMVRKITHIG